MCKGSFRSSDKVHLSEGWGDCFQCCQGNLIQTRPPGWWSPTRGAERAPLQNGNHARQSSQSGPNTTHTVFVPRRAERGREHTAVESFMEHKKGTKPTVQLLLQQRKDFGPSWLSYLHMLLSPNPSCLTLKKPCQAKHGCLITIP